MDEIDHGILHAFYDVFYLPCWVELPQKNCLMYPARTHLVAR